MTRSQVLATEKEALGFYLSDHPLSGTDGLFKKWVTCSIRDLGAQEHKKRVILAGIVSSLRELITKKGTRMGFVQLEDLTGTAELVVFPDVFAKAETFLKGETPILVGGVLEKDGESLKILVDQVTDSQELSAKVKRFTVRWNADFHERVKDFVSVLKSNPGGTRVQSRVRLPEVGQEALVEWEGGITLNQKFLDELQLLTDEKDFFEVQL